MSYIPDNSKAKSLAKPNALTVIKHTQGTSQTITVDNKVELDTINNWYGSFTPTISSDVITLPSGYFYYIESAAQAYANAGYSYNHVTSFQHYDETNSSYVGTIGTLASSYTESQQTFSRDSVARFLVDCSSSSINISFKIQDNPGTGHSHINYNSGQVAYAALGRTVIWQLNT